MSDVTRTEMLDVEFKVPEMSREEIENSFSSALKEVKELKLNEYKELYKRVDKMLWDICMEMDDNLEKELEQYIKSVREFMSEHIYRYENGDIVI